jgi:hypothetical protein
MGGAEMTTALETHEEQIVELDERESNGIRVTLVWNRVTDTLAVLVWDERTAQSFALEVEKGEDAYDVFNHPFAYAAFRRLDNDEPETIDEDRSLVSCSGC